MEILSLPEQAEGLQSHKPLSIYLTLNRQGLVSAINPESAAYLGYRVEELLGSPGLELFHPDDRLELQPELQESGISERSASSHRVRLLCQSEQIILMNVLIQPLQTADGVSWLIVGQDATILETRDRQTVRERMVATIAQKIRQSLDLHQILSTTVKEVRQFLQTDRVIIHRFEPDWSGTVVVESVGSEWIPALNANIQDSCFIKNQAEPYRQGRIQATADIYQAGLTKCHLQLLERFQIKANLVVPILQGENLWGLLIAHHCSGVRPWQPGEVELLRQLAIQVGIAIQQSELYERVQNLNTDLEKKVQQRTTQLQQAYEFEATLKRITDKVRDSLDETKILQKAVQELAETIGIYSCTAAVYDLQQKTSKIYYRSNEILPEPLVISMDVFAEGYQQLLEGQYFQFCSLEKDAAMEQVTVLACPILDDQGVLGDLWLKNYELYTFNEQDIRLVQQVANQCAIALRQSRLYQAVQDQVEQLARLNQLKDDFLNTISHELRTPISSIQVTIQVLELVLHQLSPSAKLKEQITQYLDILQAECQREIGLINDLLMLCCLNAGTEPLNLMTIAPQPWILHIVEPFGEQIKQRKQRLELKIPDQLPLFSTDLRSLERILAELLTNAAKYTPAGETISVVAQVRDNSLQISVSNTGVEIPESELPRIFDTFYRIPNHDPWKYGGTGLGLALVKRLVEHLGAAIQVHSQNKQITFTVSFPLQ